jgi:hypothetical protein
MQWDSFYGPIWAVFRRDLAASSAAPLKANVSIGHYTHSAIQTKPSWKIISIRTGPMNRSRGWGILGRRLS